MVVLAAAAIADRLKIPLQKFHINVIGLALFYGVGFGIGPRFGSVGVLTAGAIIFAAQLVLSRWWLERFRFRPLEWIWRTLMLWRSSRHCAERAELRRRSLDEGPREN